MYGYRNPYMHQNQRFGWFGLPFLGGLAGGLLGTALFAPRPFYPVGYGVPCCPPGFGYPGGFGYQGYPGYPFYR